MCIRDRITTGSRFSRQNDVGLRALNVVLCENLVLVLESKALYYRHQNPSRKLIGRESDPERPKQNEVDEFQRMMCTNMEQVA